MIVASTWNAVRGVIGRADPNSINHLTVETDPQSWIPTFGGSFTRLTSLSRCVQTLHCVVLVCTRACVLSLT